MNYEIEALANAHCVCGENPLWDSNRRRVFWTDIETGRVFCLDVASGDWKQIYSGEKVGGFTLQDDGSLVVFRVNEFARLDVETGNVESLVCGIDANSGRFNDVMADADGSVLAGTMGRDGNFGGGLYRVDLNGNVTPLWSGTNCANGMGFSPDRKTFYWTDSTAHAILAFDHENGNFSNRRVLVQVADGEGTPDGMAVDCNGEIWSARWGGYGIFHFDSEGKLIEKIELPVAKVSSVTFGGDDLNELCISTAGGETGSQTADGTLYRVRVEAKGQREYRSRVRV